MVNDIGFAKISDENSVDTKIFKDAFNLNKKIFGRTPKKFKIIICETEKEFKKESKYYYHKNATATVLRNNNLITRSPKFIAKIGKQKKADFSSIINHEMNHVFWNDFYKATCKPCWLLEGFACYVGKNYIVNKKDINKIIIKHNVDYSILHYRYIEKKFRKIRPYSYEVWQAFTKYLAEKYGTKTIIKLMDEYSKKLTREHYDKSFKKVFKRPEKTLFNEFLFKTLS